MSWSYKSFTVKGNDRRSNSDYILVKELSAGWIGIVCDGVGETNGKINAGKICAEKVIEKVQNSSLSDPLMKVKSAIEETNKYLKEIQENNPEDFKIASTLVILYFTNHTFCYGHVGDSRIYELKNGRLHLLTKDHSVIQELIDKGMLTLKEAALHTGTNIIGKAIGDKPNVAADVSQMYLQPLEKYRFLMCTDGLTNLLPDTELERCLQKEKLDDCYNCFVNAIEKLSINDDTSFLIVDPF